MRAALYVRVSTDKQEKDGTSLESQEVAGKQYCAAQSHSFLDTYVFRETHSGAELWERPSLTKLREAIRKRAIDVVVVYAVDRLSRNQYHLGLLLSEAERYGVQYEFVTERLEDTPHGRFLRNALSFAADLEREKIQERTSRGKRQLALSGRPIIGRKPAFGYCLNDSHTGYLINEEEAAIVRRVFSGIASGQSLHDLVLQFAREGINRPIGKGRYHAAKWNRSTLHRICENPMYWGEPTAYRWKVQKTKEYDDKSGAMRSVRRIIERPIEERIPLPISAIPPIVDPYLAKQVQDRLAFNRAHVRRPTTHEDGLLYGGHIYCEICKRHMSLHRFGERYHRSPVYRCHVSYEEAIGTELRQHAIAAHPLDEQVWELLEQRLSEPEFLKKAQQLEENDESIRADLEAVEHRIQEIAEEQANLSRHLARIDDDTIAAPLLTDLARLAQHKRGAQDEKTAVQARLAAWEFAQRDACDTEEWLIGLRRWMHNANFARKREILRQLQVEVYIRERNFVPRWSIKARIRLAGREGVIVTNLVPLATINPTTEGAGKSA